MKCGLCVVIFCFLLECGDKVHASVTLLLESPGHAKNTSNLGKSVYEANRRENERVTGKIFLTRDKDIHDAWRTEKGELVQLQYLKTNHGSNSNAVEIGKGVTNTKVDESMKNSVTGTSVHLDDNYPQVNNVAPSSYRMKRTFWPFTSLFGNDYYDYYSPPPPPPPFGLFDTPFFPGFGGFFGGGGLGYPPPPFAGRGPMFGPPPPPFGFDFTFGI